MSITTSTGLFSGIDSGTLIEQLLAIEARPKLLAQQRIAQLQRQQAAYLDINSQLSGLKTAAAAFRVDRIFESSSATSTDANVLTATASAGAPPGSYSFIVNQLVSSQQWLSRGFADSSTAGLGADSFTFESAQGRLDRDTELADLNGGAGVERGKIVIADADGATATIDLSTAATVGEVIEAINGATDVAVTASVQGGRLVVTHDEGKNIKITSAYGYNTAASLGIEQTTLAGPQVTGSRVHYLSESTPLGVLNDGNGVYVAVQSGEGTYDFTIDVGGTAVNVNLGGVYEMVDGKLEQTEPAVTTLGGVLERINGALESVLGNTHVRAGINAAGTGLRIEDAEGRTIEVREHAAGGRTTAADLGLRTSSPAPGVVEGATILAGLNSTLARTLNGGAGIAGDGSISITGRDGQNYSITIDPNGSVSDILSSFGAATGGMITASLNKTGTGIVLSDNTGGAGNLIVSGETAESLGIATDAGGVAASTIDSGSLQHQYVTVGTLLASLNGGKGVGSGTFRITDSTGKSAIVDIGSGDRTLGDVINEINTRNTRIRARVNDKGDGLELYEEDDGNGGASKIKVEDVTGATAKGLRIAGEAAGTGAENVIDGSGETTVEFDPTDTLQQIVTKINSAGVGVSAAIINDGAGSSPFRLSLTATASGSAGRMTVDTGSLDLGLTQLDAGRDAKVFFGATDPARAVLLTSSTNTLDGVVQGVSIDLHSPSANPVTLTVSRNTEAIEEAVNKFVGAFNAVIDRIAAQSKYTQETNTKGPLLGDATTQTLRRVLFSTVQTDATGVDGRFRNLSQVGLSVGTGGKLELDTDVLREALAEDPGGVADLFAARVLEPKENEDTDGDGITISNPDAPDTFTSLGVVPQIEELIKSYTDTVDGVMTLRTRGIDDQIRLQQRRIESFDAKLANKREVLQRQFLAMEQAIAQLQSQQSSLSAIQLIG